MRRLRGQFQKIDKVKDTREIIIPHSVPNLGLADQFIAQGLNEPLEAPAVKAGLCQQGICDNHGQSCQDACRDHERSGCGGDQTHGGSHRKHAVVPTPNAGPNQKLAVATCWAINVAVALPAESKPGVALCNAAYPDARVMMLPANSDAARLLFAVFTQMRR
ncbi:MAG: hypothetical protein MZV63_66685 [Marinilabiliales bacterium]|nr:hypothetical protein [Marinilabiliales bacterium]